MLQKIIDKERCRIYLSVSGNKPGTFYFIIIEGRKFFPDFTFIDDAGDEILWEHLGLLSKADYKERWEWKKSWYEDGDPANKKKGGGRFKEGVNLFTTTEGPGLDMQDVVAVADKIAELLE